MPYSGPNDFKLPDTVKALSTEKRAQWANVWNSAYARCQENDGEDCEGAAFRMANGVVFEEAEIFTPPSRLGIDGRLSVLELRALSKDDTKAAKWAQGILDKLSEAAMSEQEITEMSDVGVMSYTPMGATSFADLRTAEQADVAANEVHRLTYQFQSLVSNIMSDPTIEEKSGAIEALAGEFVMLVREALGDTMTEESDGEQLSEFDAPGLAVEARDATEADLSEAGVEAAENGRRAPVVIDFEVLKPGPGNKQQNRYYLPDTVRRDIHVFEGAPVFVTDHRENERSERTKVGKVIKCPTRFEGDIPVGEVLIYDPDQAEKARNRHDAGVLDTLECSIYGKGRGRDGKIDGQKYKIIEAITEGVYLELVSKAGAGGRAVGLSESSDGGETMEKEQVKQPADETQVEEVEITENQNESAPETEPVTMLEADAVQAALDKTRLPDTFKRALALAEYEDETALQKAVDQAVAEVKSLTGSGQPFAQGASEPTESAPDFDTIEAEHTDRINEILAEVGIRS